MLLIIWALLLGATYSVALSFIPLSIWFLFLWIPLGLILGVVTVVLYVYICLIIWSKTKPTGKYRHHILRQVVILIRLFSKVSSEAVGLENLPKNTNFVIYSNHKSMIDPVFIYYHVHGVCGAAGKSTLFKNKIMVRIRKSFGCISIDRQNDREALKSMLEGIELVKKGMSMIIFPEGGIKTRETEEMIDLKPGAYKLATKANAPIVPCAVIGSSKVASRKKGEKIHVKIIFQKPIYPEEYSGMNTTDLGLLVENGINEAIRNEK